MLQMVSRSLGPRPTQPQNSAARYKLDVARDQSRSLLRCDPDKPMKGCGYHALKRRGRAQRRVTKAAFSEAVLASHQADAVAWGCLIPESGRSLNPIQAATMAERFVTPGETGQEAVQESNGAESLHLNDAPA